MPFIRLVFAASSKTAANLVRLARGQRPFEDREHDAWMTRPYDDGTLCHRATPAFMVQGVDPEGIGQGGPGHMIADEFAPSVGHDHAGLLSMANRGAGTRTPVGR